MKTRPDQDRLEYSKNSGAVGVQIGSWERPAYQIFGDGINDPKAGQFVRGIKNTLAEFRKQAPETANVLEQALPASLQLASELSQMTAEFKNLDPDALAAEIKLLLPADHPLANNPAGLLELSKQTINFDFHPLNQPRNSEANRPADAKAKQLGFRDTLASFSEAFKFSPSPITPEGLRLSLTPEKNPKTDIMDQANILAGLTGAIKRERFLTIAAAGLATYFLLPYAIDTTAKGLAHPGAAQDIHFHLAQAVWAFEYFLASRLITPLSDEEVEVHHQNALKAQAVIGPIKLDQDSLDKVVGAMGIGLFAAAIGFDLWTGFQGSGEAPYFIQDLVPKLLITGLSVFGPLIALPALYMSGKDILNRDILPRIKDFTKPKSKNSAFGDGDTEE